MTSSTLTPVSFKFATGTRRGQSACMSWSLPGSVENCISQTIAMKRAQQMDMVSLHRLTLRMYLHLIVQKRWVDVSTPRTLMIRPLLIFGLRATPFQPYIAHHKVLRRKWKGYHCVHLQGEIWLANMGEELR